MTGTEFTNLADLASARVGGRAIATNDDFFAPKSNLVKPEPAVWIPDKYTSKGKWMDGWESRRRRVPGHDWCIVQLGMRGIVHGVNVDTSHFTGNYPSHCSIEAIDLARGGPRPSAYATEGPPWTTLLEKTALRGNGDNLIAIDDRRPWTHLRLSIYPDGGVARLRVYGEVSVDWKKVAPGDRVVDLASIANGGLFLDASDTHYGTRGALIMPDRAKNMGDGWETRRRRGPGHDWAIVRLGATGIVSKVEIDTNHYKGNYPDRASLDGCLAPGATVEQLRAAAWSAMLPETKLSANKRHYFSGKQLQGVGPFSHVRLNIFPDGGVSRLRVHGKLAGN